MTFNNAPAPLTLRANRLRLDREALLERLRAAHVGLRPGRFAPDALIVEHGQPLAGPGLDEGWFVVQDEASQLVPLLAGSRPGPRILDACASPGGKTTALAVAAGSPALIVATDVRAHRMALLRHTVEATGAAGIRLVQADLRVSLPFLQPFDCVLVDAPCSGTGTLRRDPDIRWRRREVDLPVLAEAQLEMLRHAATAVAPGGRLIYATCSSEPEENEQVVDAWLAGSFGFAPLDARRAAPELPEVLVDHRGHLRTTPARHGLEAFFGAVFERAR